MNNLCLYHANCPDGFTAAFAVWLRYGNTFEYIPVKYQEPPPINKENYDKILIVDFSYPLDILEEMEKICQGILVIDHHDTCPQEYRNLIFNREKSGCILIWEYLFPYERVPELFLYVQDRDLWKWEMEDSRAVNLGLETVPKRFEDYLELINNYEHWNKIKEKGKILYEYKKGLIDQNASLAWIGDALGYEGIVCCEVSIPSLISEVGEELRNRYPESPFVLLYGINKNQLIVSLRTIDRNIHLGELAKKRGGGGHPAAAGFKKNLTQDVFNALLK